MDSDSELELKVDRSIPVVDSVFRFSIRMYKYTPTHTAPRTDPNPSNSAVASPMRFNATPMREQAREPAPQTQPLKPLQSESTINSENNTSVDIKQFVQQYHQVNRVENTSPGGNAAFNTSSHSDDGTYGFKGDASGNMNANQSQTQTAKLVQVATLQKARIDELNSTIDDLRKELKDYKRMVTDRSTVKVRKQFDDIILDTELQDVNHNLGSRVNG